MREYIGTMPRAQNRAAKGSILKEDEILFQSGYIVYLCLNPILWWFSMINNTYIKKTICGLFKNLSAVSAVKNALCIEHSPLEGAIN